MGIEGLSGIPAASGIGALSGISSVKGLGKGAPDPLADVEYSGDLEQDCERELSAMEQAYRDRARAEDKRFTNATDSEFWFAVCFRDRAEKDAFLAEFGVGRLGDKYVDGALLAKALRKLVDEGR